MTRMMQSNSKTSSCYCLYGFSILLALIILLIVYPGFMSYDSFHALREARGEVQGGSYPPYVSYVWRLFDWIWPGPSLMLLVQNSLLLLSLAHILKLSGLVNHYASYLLLIMVAACPPLLGSMVVVWKDVAVGSCFLAVIAISMQMQQSESMLKKTILFCLGCFFLFSGMAYRFNATSGAVPLFFYLYWTLFNSHLVKSNLSKKIKHTSISLAIFTLLFSSVHIINNHRLPDFKPFKPNSGFVAIAVFDLIGISNFEEKLVYSDSLNKSELLPSAKLLHNIYEPNHLNLTRQNYIQADPEGFKAIFDFKEGINVFDAWINSVINHPLSYLAHRGSLTKGLIGYTNDPQFYPTHQYVDQNEYDIILVTNELNKTLVDYIFHGVDDLKIRPWVIYILMFLLVPFFLFFSKNKLLILTIFSSSILYLFPMIFILPAADLRYNFWCLVSAIVCIIIGIINLPFTQKYIFNQYE